MQGLVADSTKVYRKHRAFQYLIKTVILVKKDDQLQIKMSVFFRYFLNRCFFCSSFSGPFQIPSVSKQ